jgi:hypothetical protein
MTQIHITIDVNPEWLKKKPVKYGAQVLGIMVQKTIQDRGKVCDVKAVEDRFTITPKGLEALRESTLE